MRVPALTYSQHKVVVGLVVDGVQDVKHVDGEVRDGAEMRGDGRLRLEFTRQESHRKSSFVDWRKCRECVKRRRGRSSPGEDSRIERRRSETRKAKDVQEGEGDAALTSEEVVGTSPTAAMYVLPIVLIFSMSR